MIGVSETLPIWWKNKNPPSVQGRRLTSRNHPHRETGHTDICLSANGEKPVKATFCCMALSIMKPSIQRFHPTAPKGYSPFPQTGLPPPPVLCAAITKRVLSSSTPDFIFCYLYYTRWQRLCQYPPHIFPRICRRADLTQSGSTDTAALAVGPRIGELYSIFANDNVVFMALFYEYMTQ